MGERLGAVLIWKVSCCASESGARETFLELYTLQSFGDWRTQIWGTLPASPGPAAINDHVMEVEVEEHRTDPVDIFGDCSMWIWFHIGCARGLSEDPGISKQDKQDCTVDVFLAVAGQGCSSGRTGRTTYGAMQRCTNRHILNYCPAGESPVRPSAALRRCIWRKYVCVHKLSDSSGTIPSAPQCHTAEITPKQPEEQTALGLNCDPKQLRDWQAADICSTIAAHIVWHIGRKSWRWSEF
ncbi:hypothetical protein BKA93DRAFT_456176 [Sparassis latifolia]